jgi:hypothetical protein
MKRDRTKAAIASRDSSAANVSNIPADFLDDFEFTSKVCPSIRIMSRRRFENRPVVLVGAVLASLFSNPFFRAKLDVLMEQYQRIGWDFCSAHS